MSIETRCRVLDLRSDRFDAHILLPVVGIFFIYHSRIAMQESLSLVAVMS